MEKKILLVDDEEGIRKVLGITLSDSGYRVFLAENGQEAFRIFKTESPPIVMTDIKMPGMDGIELLKNIKRLNPDTEVIMITGHGDMDLAITSLKHKATDFITKPINDDIMEIALKKAHDNIIVRKQLREYTQNLEALLHEKSALQDRLSSLGLRISSISHGIKGMLTGLDGGMYLLDSGIAKNDQDQLKEGWGIVKQMVDRIRKMVLDILFYAKERELKTEKVDVLSFTRDVASMVEPKIKEKQIEFVQNFEKSLGEFEIDPGFVRSAIINILENAIDACIKQSSKNYHKIVFEVKQDKNDIRFDVHDTGIGMDSDTKKKVFDLFFSSKGSQGTGLGLFIASKVIGQHGGSIEVASTPGHGSHFCIRLPKKLPEFIKTASSKQAK
ncbi:MAG: hybrid sensor histidine kinase/response regulator [Thermodesulfobacteriota bacterium]|nr:hybrid sensor histidine kinase/response regulator [Thermodesulfobacteriota bacterium]